MKPIRMGPIKLNAPMMQAGLAAYSDRAMRLVARRRGCPYAVTEAILDRMLLAGGKGLANSIDINDEDHPVAGQIMGSEPSEMAAAAKIMAERGYDVIDLNFACPVKKVKNKARGGWMLADVPRGEAILRAVREVLPQQPLSLSLRRGFDDSDESEDNFWRLCETARELGFVALRVHARTVEQKYAGRSRRPFLADVKRAFADWTIWGSGDVFEPEDVFEMLAQTGVDGVWIARGAIGNPWIFRDAMKLLSHGSGIEPQIDTDEHRLSSSEIGTPRTRDHEGAEAAATTSKESRRPGAAAGAADSNICANLCQSVATSPSLAPPTVAEQREALAEHFEIAMQIHGESLAGRRMRKIGIKYARFHPSAAEVKKRFIAIRSLADWRTVLEGFYAHDAPGLRPPRDAANEVNDAAESCESAV